MGSYSDWITGRRNTYKTAITNAYNAHQASSGNDYETAYDAMNADSDVRVLIPPQNNTAFYGSSPNATEAQINTLQTWLQANPTQAGRLNLAAEATASDDTIRKSLGGAGNVGTEKRRWKGNPLYTFGNGIVVGKSDKIVAAIGTNGGNAIDGFGTDTLVYFDGIPFSKGTGLPGTAVFAGDLVVSGSIQGTGGIVIIDDVIQLERGVSNPAGIGVDDTGKIRLRHRGQGFLDLVDEVEKAKSGSIEDAKLWVGTQNTNSARWGNSLIPNSNFSLIRAEGSYTSGNYVERPAGVISAGTTSEIVTLTDGIATFAANGQGIIMQAIPIDCERYTVRIRYKGSTAVTPSGNNQAQGVFLAFHETSDDDATIDGKSFIYDNSTPAANTSDNSNVHTGNVTVKYPASLRSTDNSTHDGAPIPTSYTIRSYTYEPTAGTKNASLVIHASNYGSATLDIDYVVLTENPKTTAEINGLITTATAGIEGETGSIIPNAVMTDKTKWAAIGGASLTENANGGDGGSGDAAIEVTTSGSGQGITSSAIDCAADRYLVGIRIKTTSGTTNISIAGVETAGPFYGALGDSAPTLVPGASDYRTKTINVDTINGSGQPSGSPAATKSVGTSWTTIIGTYEPNRLDPSSYAVGYTTPTGGPAHILPGKFSLAIRADSACTFVVDYVFAQIQTASINLAQSLANSAYGDSQTFVTAINDLLIKESGSIITNASMALPSSASNGPAGYRARGTNAVIATTTDGSGDKQVKVTSSESEGVDRVLISPPFALGSADKFSIGVRCKSLESGDVDVSIAIALTTETSLPSGKVTYAASGGSDVYTTSVTESQLTIDDVSNTQGGNSSLADKYDWAVGTSYENVVGTFERKTVDSSYSKKSASVVITANGDFEVDYIFVKEQICSFSLADETAGEKRDEAIAQATGALQGMTNSLGQESGSLLANASFGSYLYDGSTYQLPKNWAKTRSTTRIHRVVGATEAVTHGSQTVTPDGEQVAAISQVGACALVTTGGNVNGILSSYFQLPYNDSSSNSGLGKYTIGLRLKVDKAETAGIRILAHEATTPPDGSQEFILCTSSGETAFATGTARASTIHSDHTAKTYTVTAGSTGSTAQITLINISQEDVDVGYLSDDYIEYFPVDNAPDTQGDTDATVQNETAWYALAGTYTPSTGAQYVSFEIIIEDQDTGDAARANVYIDYVSLVPQTVDADFASTIATARTENAIDNLEDDPPQTGELIANPYFISSNKTQTGGYPKKWMPYGSNPPYSILSFVNNTTKRGLHVAGSDSSHAGVFSRPFRTSSDDYEIKVRAKRSGVSDTDAKLEVYVYEYDSDIADTVEAIISAEGHVPSSKTVSGGHVVLGNVSGSPQTMQATSHSNDTDPVMGTSYAIYTYEYIPHDSTRYASILVRTDDLATSGFDISHVSCVVDNTKTGTRLFGAFRGKALADLDVASFADVGAKLLTTTLKNNITANNAKTTFPGFGDAGFATAVGNLSDTQFPSSVRNSGITLSGLGGLATSDFNSTFDTRFGTKSVVTDSNFSTKFNSNFSAKGVSDFPSALQNSQVTKSSLGLGNVENKSAATIQSELSLTTAQFKAGAQARRNNFATFNFNSTANQDPCLDSAEIAMYETTSNQGHLTGHHGLCVARQHTNLAGNSYGFVYPEYLTGNDIQWATSQSRMASVEMITFGDGKKYQDSNSMSIYCDTDGDLFFYGDSTLRYAMRDHGNIDIYQSSYGGDDGLRLFPDNGLSNESSHYWTLTTIAKNSDGDSITTGTISYSRLYFYSRGKNGYAAYLGNTNSGAIQTFTGQHRCKSENIEIQDHLGLIVVSTGKYDTRGITPDQKQVTINNTHPIVKLADKRNQKSCYGVISDKEDLKDGQIEYNMGPFGFHPDILEDDEARIIINSIGEGAVWVCNINGDLENGDYITTCEIPGYGMLQGDDLLHNYTVAKITQDCTFELDNPNYDCVEFEFEGQTYRKAFVGCTYHCG